MSLAALQTEGTEARRRKMMLARAGLRADGVMVGFRMG